MNYWNLLMVLCFLVLYMGVSLVFSRLRRLQKELKNDYEQLREQQQQASGVAQAATAAVGERITAVENRLEQQFQAVGTGLVTPLTDMEKRLDLRLQTMGERLQGEIQTIHGELRHVSRQEDTYREARLLLSYGVDEERVVAETGRTMEEIRLLKRVTCHNNRFGQVARSVRTEAVTTQWDYAPVEGFMAKEERLEHGLGGFMAREERLDHGLVQLVIPETRGHIGHTDRETVNSIAAPNQQPENTIVRPAQEVASPVGVPARNQQKRQANSRGQWRQKGRRVVQTRTGSTQEMIKNPIAYPEKGTDGHS